MLSLKPIEDKIIKKLKTLPDEEKKDVLHYIDSLQNKTRARTIKSLKKTSGAWRGLVDSEKLKTDMYSNRMMSRRANS